MKKCLLMILMITLTNNVFAQNSISIVEGEKATFTGILVKESKLVELIKSDKKVPLLQTKLDLQTELITFHHEDAMLQRRKLSEAKFRSYIKVIGAFLTGVIVTSFAMKINNKIGDI